MEPEAVTIERADLERPEHQRAIVEMTAAYARDPMGNDAPLDADVLEALVPALRRHPTTLVWLAWRGDRPVGIATCFLGFSTFAARPVINVHDLCVVQGERGRGIATALLRAVESSARERGCAKVTLEVQEHNAPARRLYEALGFAQAVYARGNGGALFFAKDLRAEESPARPRSS